MHRTSLWLIQFLFAAIALAGTLPSQSFFVANEGQWDGAFAFKYQVNDAAYFVTETGMTIDLHELQSPSVDGGMKGGLWPSPTSVGERERVRHPAENSTIRGHVLRLSYLHANPSPVLIGQDKLSSYSNYFLSKDSCRWRPRVGHYRRVVAQGVWNGIDVEYRTTQEGVETVYHLQPGADPAQIQLRYEGQDGTIAMGTDGSLQLRTSLGPVSEKAPFAYQIIQHTQREIPCRFEVLSDQSYRLNLGAHDPTQELVIDPEVVYSTYWGNGMTEDLYGMAVDADNNPIVSGYDMAGIQTTPGAYQETRIHGFDGFISKFAADGHTLLFSTYFPSSLFQVFAEANGCLILCGLTTGVYWPVTANGFDSTIHGGGDIGLAELSADGATLNWGSLWGGSSQDQFGSGSIALSPEGLLYLAVATESVDYPLTDNALFREPEGTYNCSALTVFDLHTMTVPFSSYFHSGVREAHGGLYVFPLSGGVVWLTGESDTVGVLPLTPEPLYSTFTAAPGYFFARLRLQPPTIEYASYFGNQTAGSRDWLNGVMPVDSNHVVLAGNAWGNVAGFAMPPGGMQPGSAGLAEGFLVKVALPDSMTAGTFLGGSSFDMVEHTVRDESGSFVLQGLTQSSNFPVTPDAFQHQFHPGQGAGNMDWFVARLSADLTTLRYSTFLGGSDQERELDYLCMNDLAHVWIGGASYSQDYPTTPDALVPDPPYGDYAVLTRFDLRDSADTATPPFILHPSSFSLSCFPNPFNPTTTLSFVLPSPSVVKLEVFDVLGRKVYQKDLGRLAAGEHRERFEGEKLSSGIYFARVQTEKTTRLQKLMLLR